MDKTLADFKRAIHTGMEIECTGIEERKYSDEHRTHVGEWYPVPIADGRKGARYVSYVDTTGFYLKRSDDKLMRGSFCAFPKADNLEYDGDTFIITERGMDREPYQRRHYRIIIT